MEQKDEGVSLDDEATKASEESKDIAVAENTPEPKKVKPPLGKKLRNLIGHFNIYLLIFILIVIFVSGFTFASYLKQKKQDAAPTTQTQELDAESLKQLKSSDTTVGDPKQTLTVQSNAIFNGKVLVRDDLDIAGTLKVGGTLNLTGLIVSGTTSLDQVQGNKLSIAGDGNIQGQLTVQNGLTISGGVSFGGNLSAPTLSVESLQLSGDLTINRHIDAGGATPTSTNGGALGSGGTTSVSGTDTAGTIAINTGGSPIPGCFLTLTFSKSFNAQPHIAVTPIGGSAASLNYYVNRTSNGFSLCTANSAPASANFAFDYIVID
jgi:cytoskeletal protein CcmA (bactofilin family)